VSPPCIRFEDEHLLVVDKPAGWNTHAPAPLAGAGIYDWLRDREPRWQDLALLHRLDKETSGLMVFGKTTAANRGLSRQFEARQVAKTYRFLTDRPAPFQQRTVRSALVRSGERYLARPVHAGSTEAITHLQHVGAAGPFTLWEARPVTGLTHQVRVHAAEAGLPILGDALYSGTLTGPGHPGRLCLHAEALAFNHPVTALPQRFQSPQAFADHGPWSLRAAAIEPELTDAFRLVHGLADGRPGMILERWGDYLLWQTDAPPTETGQGTPQTAWVRTVAERVRARAIYAQTLHRRLQGRSPQTLSPAPGWGAAAPSSWCVRENGLRYEISFAQGYSVGLFLDQRDNRRRLSRNHVARRFPVCADGLAGATLLNAFAYTCGFSVSAAVAGARTTSVDLSRKALDWGRRNFRLNDIDPAVHEFLAGDALDWARRLHRRGRQFDVVLLDPPTFSRSRPGGLFRAEKDYGALVQATLPLLKAGGTLLVSTNAVTLEPGVFLDQVNAAIACAGRRVARQCFAPPPPDFPWHRSGGFPMKSFWLQVE
jgi:23S rRNA (cytosine1962-C5)-methyltransferase